MLTYADVCEQVGCMMQEWGMGAGEHLDFAGLCWMLGLSALSKHVCSRMLTYADVC
jgi:hypothetical protein